MNVYDTQRMVDILAPLGFAETAAPEDADLVILNTCHIREKAAEKVYSELGRLRTLRERRQAAGGKLAIAVAGCVAQAEGEEMRRRAPIVDLVFGPQSYHRLPHLLDQIDKGGAVETDFPVEDKFEALADLAAPADRLAPNRQVLTRGPTAFVTIQEGCDKFCTFCVVPYTRGSEYSRPQADIAKDVRDLVQAGVREVTLLGQNVNAYHGAGDKGAPGSLAGLLHHLSQIDGLARLRYTTSHPRDMDDALIDAHGALPKVMPYLHLPVQSGSDRILKAMNRQHSAAAYCDMVARIRKARPDIALSSDFIVGFPGETDADFDATMDLVREVQYAQAYSFKYSPRPGTPAADDPDQVPEPVKAARLQKLQALLSDQQAAFNKACVGRQMPVLLERPGRNPGQLVGRSPYLQAVYLEADEQLIGRLVTAEIEAIGANSLKGRLVKEAPSRQETVNIKRVN